MTIDDQLRDEKLHYDIYIEAAKISALSSGQIDKYEYLTGEEILSSLTGEEILSSNKKKQKLEQAKFACSPLGKAS